MARKAGCLGQGDTPRPQGRTPTPPSGRVWTCCWSGPQGVLLGNEMCFVATEAAAWPVGQAGQCHVAGHTAQWTFPARVHSAPESHPHKLASSSRAWPKRKGRRASRPGPGLFSTALTSARPSERLSSSCGSPSCGPEAQGLARAFRDLRGSRCRWDTYHPESHPWPGRHTATPHGEQ